MKVNRFSRAAAFMATTILVVGIPIAALGVNSGIALHVSISQIKNTKGKLVVALFDSKEHFLEQTVSEFSLDIGEDGTAVAWFSNIPPGVYAIAAYHDKNSDGKLNTFMLVPREDYGFSNNARSIFGPPSFKSASFEVGEQDMGVEFRIR